MLCYFLAALSILVPPIFGAAQASPPLPKVRFTGPPSATPVLAGGGIRAALVKAWAGGGATAWQELNVEWPQYGETPIYVDPALAGTSSFSYEALVATGADVLILSDPAGGLHQFSHEEVLAIRRYAEEGHNLIGTYLVFRWNVSDNTDLAPLFGLRSDLEYTPYLPVPLSNEFHDVLPFNPLTDGLKALILRRTRRWQSSGWPYSEVPVDDNRWDAVDLQGAKIVAQCDDRTGIVSVYATPSYLGIFFSNMPEYFGSSVDKQILYNAIVLPSP